MLRCRCWPLLFMCTQTCSHSSSFVAGKATPFLSHRRQLPPARPPFACEIQGPQHLILTACAHCLNQQGANGRAGCGGAAVLVPGDVQGCVVSLARLGRQGHQPLLEPSGLRQRTLSSDRAEGNQDLLSWGMAASPHPLLTPSDPRDVPQGRNQGDFQETGSRPNSWTFHACSHQCPFSRHSVPEELTCPSTSHGRGATGVSSPSEPRSSPHVPRGCYGAMCGRTSGTKIELRTTGIGPFRNLPHHQPCGQSPPHITPSPFPDSCRSGWGCSSCRAPVETMGLCCTPGPSLGAGTASAPSPAQREGQGPATAQMQEQCHAGRSLAKALRRHCNASSESGESALVTQGQIREIQTQSCVLCSPLTGFLAPLDLRNSPQAVC